MDLSQSGGSAWGGFLKKAMEGVEQQLDRVLENPPPKAIARDAAKLKDAITPPGVQAPSRTGSGSSRMTLQERLAASVAKSRTGSPKIVTSATEDSTGESVKISGESMRETNGSGAENGSVETTQIETSDVPVIPVRTETPAIREPLELPSRTETPDLQAIPGDEESTQPSPSQPPPTIAPKPILPPEVTITTEILIPPEPSTPILPSPTRTSSTRPSTSQPPSSLPSDTDPGTADLISQLRSDLATCESRRIEESQQSTLRITSLEEKLKLLTEITRHRSKEIVADTTESAWERKLADREEKIALLLDEGEKLAKIELNLMTTIKSLRSKQKEDERTVITALSRAEKAEKQATELKTQLKKAQEIERKNTERLKGMYKIEAANEVLRREKESTQTVIVGLQNALAEATTRADEAVAQIQTEALEKERITNTELRETLERVRTEFSLLEDSSKNEIKELKDRLEKEQRSSKIIKDDLTSEITNLESKLEVLRSRAEESSTWSNSDAQAKLLRQIEMVQTQHAIASQNWQRIEGSLQLRTEALEKERNDLTKRLDEEKRKVKEAIDGKRNIQSQLTDVQSRIRHLESDLLKSQSQSQSLQETINLLESRLTDQQSSFTKEKESLHQSFLQDLDLRLKEEKQKWEDEHQENILFTPPPISGIYPSFPPPSPRHAPPGRGFKSVSPQPEKRSGPFSRNTSYGELPPLRRPSRNFSSDTLNTNPTPTTIVSNFPNLHISTPNLHSISALEDEEEREFLNPSRGESPRNTVVEASVSTNAAGPSVNIMERMSAAVRRLESDLATTREEMGRCVRQRDGAREECVKLMGEVEEKRRVQREVEELQRKFGDLENRYNEALVLLGEKSERVEELQMDIVDLKEGYQHALQRLVGDK